MQSKTNFSASEYVRNLKLFNVSKWKNVIISRFDQSFVNQSSMDQSSQMSKESTQKACFENKPQKYHDAYFKIKLLTIHLIVSHFKSVRWRNKYHGFVKKKTILCINFIFC